MMRKLICSCIVVCVILYVLPALPAASAACGEDPPAGVSLSWPADGTISASWTLECVTDRGHRGIDIDIPAGRQISASASGTVIFAGYTPAEGGGTTVSLEHAGGFRTTYLHLTQLSVTEGQYVVQGQVLALSDGTPLHFGVKSAGSREEYFNPLLFLPGPGLPGDPSTGPAGETEPATDQPSSPIETPSFPATAEASPSLVTDPAQAQNKPLSSSSLQATAAEGAPNTTAVNRPAILRDIRDVFGADTSAPFPTEFLVSGLPAEITDPGVNKMNPATGESGSGRDRPGLSPSRPSANALKESSAPGISGDRGLFPYLRPGLLIAVLVLLAAAAGRLLGIAGGGDSRLTNAAAV